MYTELNDARVQIKTRFAEPGLKEEVENFLKNLPEQIRCLSRPMAVMARQVATPNFESIRFWETTSGNGLTPIWLEYSRDRFSSANVDKVMLAKLIFYYGKGRNGGNKTSIQKIVDIERASKKAICDIRTRVNSEVSLLDIHSRMFESYFPLEAKRVDISSWIQEIGDSAPLYYEAFLSLFICHGVLFENFLLEGREGEFSKSVVIPAFEKVQKRFGIKPLVVSLLPRNRAANNSWGWYPGQLEELVRS